MYRFARPLLFRMDAESAHTLTLRGLSTWPALGRVVAGPVRPSEGLAQNLWGHSFPHPIGLAAGLDKNGEAVDAFFNLGFSFMEVGTVTPRPQPGNEKPRLFRLIEDDALINRMGFNNEGAARLRERLLTRQAKGILGVNLGKNKVTENASAVDDYTYLIRELYDVADYFVINVSSPNTPGLRDLQAHDTLVPLVEAVLAERSRQSAMTSSREPSNTRTVHTVPPVLVKLAPDLDDEAIVNLASHLEDAHVDGFIATNTTITRNNLTSAHRSQGGGLSGRPLRERSTEVVSLVYQATGGRIPIIASGGVFTADDAYEKVRAGASLIEIYTALIYRGPGVIREMVEELAQLLQRDGFHSITQAVGSSQRL